MASAPTLVPTRRAEEWRYSDLDAVAEIWPLPAPEVVAVSAGGVDYRAILQDESDNAATVCALRVDVAAGGRFGLHLLNIGGRLGRISLDITLHEGARFDLSAAQIGGTGQTLELVTRVTHAEPNAVSRQTVRSVLAGNATGSYLGKVAVARGADGTDAEQSVKAMLLSRSATANAKPELEIFADDVKCAHGASVGELDEAALFYCAARGLDPARTRTILLQAFIAGLFDDIADDATRGRFEAAALAKLEQLA